MKTALFTAAIALLALSQGLAIAAGNEGFLLKSADDSSAPPETAKPGTPTAGKLGDGASNSYGSPVVGGKTTTPAPPGNNQTPTRGIGFGTTATTTNQKAVEIDKAAKAAAEDKKYLNPNDSDESVAAKITRLGQEGTKHFYTGVVQVAIGITQVSLAQQEKAENGPSDENQNVLNAGLQNIGEGTVKVETARDIVNHANGIAQHENKRASVGSSGAMPLLPSPSFESEKASSDANEKLKEMEEVAGVPAASLIAAVNSGGGHNEVLSIAGSAKGVHLSESEVASIPQFSFSTASTESWGNPSTPTATGNVSFTGAMKGLSGSLSTGKTTLAPAVERKPTSISSVPRSVTEEPLLSLGADNLLRSISGKSTAESGEGSLFQRVRQQYSKRLLELAAKGNGSKASSAR